MNHHHHTRTVTGMGMVLLAAMLWGTTGTAQSLGSAGLPAHWVGALRLGCAAVFFGVVMLLAGRARGGSSGLRDARDGSGLAGAVPGTGSGNRHSPQHVPWAGVLLGGLCMAAYNLSFFAGVRASSVAVGTAVALGSGPIWAGLLALLLQRRAPPRAWWAGTLLAVAGGCWMVLGSAAQLRISGSGIALCLVAGLSYAVYALVSKRLVGTASATTVTARIFGCAALLALPAAWWVSGAPVTTAQGWAVMAYLGVAATGVAYLLFTHALQRISSSTAVSLCLAEPLTAFALAVLFVGERPPLAAYAGLLLVLAGLLLVMRAELRAAARG